VGGYRRFGSGLEFIVCTPEPAERAVELLAMTVYYNRTGRLELGHTFPIGEPWLPGRAATTSS